MYVEEEKFVKVCIFEKNIQIMEVGLRALHFSNNEDETRFNNHGPAILPR